MIIGLVLIVLISVGYYYYTHSEFLMIAHQSDETINNNLNNAKEILKNKKRLIIASYDESLKILNANVEKLKTEIENAKTDSKKELQNQLEILQQLKIKLEKTRKKLETATIETIKAYNWNSMN